MIVTYPQLKDLRQSKDPNGYERDDSESTGSQQSIADVWRILMISFLAGSLFYRHPSFAWLTLFSFIMATVNFRFDQMFPQMAPMTAMVMMVFTQVYMQPPMPVSAPRPTGHVVESK